MNITVLTARVAFFEKGVRRAAENAAKAKSIDDMTHCLRFGVMCADRLILVRRELDRAINASLLAQLDSAG